MKISILNSFGVDYQEWHALERDLLELLRANYSFFLNEDDCGHKLKDVLSEDDLMAITVILFEKNHGTALNQLAVQEIGFASAYHDALLLGEFMLVGDGECPFCGSNDIREIDGNSKVEYDQDEARLKETILFTRKICQQCQYEWSTEE